MNGVKILNESPDTVTVSRRDWSQLVSELQDALDRAAVVGRRTQEAQNGRQATRRNYLTAREARRLLGERARQSLARKAWMDSAWTGRGSRRGRRVSCRYRDGPQARQRGGADETSEKSANPGRGSPPERRLTFPRKTTCHHQHARASIAETSGRGPSS